MLASLLQRKEAVRAGWHLTWCDPCVLQRAEALKDMKPLNILSLPSGVDGSLSARSTDGGKASAGPASARGGGGGGGVTARSLSRLSIASCNSIYYDASEDLEEPPLSSALFSSLHWHGNFSCWSPISPRPNPLVTSTLDLGSLPAPEISFHCLVF